MPKQMKVVALCMCNRELPLSSLYGFIHFPGGWTVFGVSFLEMDSSFFFFNHCSFYLSSFMC